MINKGIDCEGVERSLGDLDSSGRRVGYIDAEGHCWASEYERDSATTENRFIEAMVAHENGGPLPDPIEVAIEHCINRDNVDRAAEDAISAWSFYKLVRNAI